MTDLLAVTWGCCPRLPLGQVQAGDDMHSEFVLSDKADEEGKRLSSCPEEGFLEIE